MTTVVFLGPTLPAPEARLLLPDAVYLPPAACGDVYRAVHRHAPRRILLVDGVFHQVPAVWHRELLWALSKGIAVVGAASMGALRAVELAAFGMRGIGRIHDAYVAGRVEPYDDAFDDDAEVAVAHGPTELGALPLTLSLADLRCAFADAVAEGTLDPAQARRLAGSCAEIFYAERTPERVAAVIDGVDLPPAARNALRKRLSSPGFSTKRADACEALRTLAAAGAARAAVGVTEKPGWTMERAMVWETFRQRQDAVLMHPVGDEEALDELRLTPRAWLALMQRHDDVASLLRELTESGAIHDLHELARRKHELLGPPTPVAISPARATRLFAWFASRFMAGPMEPSPARMVAATRCRDEASLLRILDRHLRFIEADERSRTPT